MNYLGLPIRAVSAFHWREECEGREVPRLTAKTGPKPSAKEQAITALMSKEERLERRRANVLRNNAANSITFSRTSQADADKQARLKGKQNNARSQ